MATKRSVTPQLISRPSELNSHVTLFELEDVVEDTPRRSKRVRRDVVKAEMCDLEDLGSPSPSPPPKTPKRRRTTTTKTKLEEEDALFASGSGKRGSVSPVKKSATRVKRESDSTPTTPKKRGSVSPKKLRVLKTPHPPPENWEEVYATIKAMRSQFIAPVDTMGCQRAQDEETDPKNRRYATLVSLMLSSQTKDEVCFAAVRKLREALGGTISIDAMIAADDAVISQAICKVGYWNKKTKFLKDTAIALRDNFNSDVPKTDVELMSLPGVGPKMTYLTLEIAWNITAGIGVDVHVHRITNLLGWHKPKTTSPEDTRLNLQSWLPKELWRDINHMMVGFGQVICKPGLTRCDYCDLSTKGLCPSAEDPAKFEKLDRLVLIKPDQDSPPEIEIAIEEDRKVDVKTEIKEETKEVIFMKTE